MQHPSTSAAPRGRARFALRALALLPLVQAGHALAVPSFARQTGEACSSCHVGSFGPQLTARGMRFKLGAYTDSDGRDGHIPLSAMLVGTLVHTDKDLSADAGPHDGENDNASLQEISGFVAGRLAPHLGSFAQFTWSDISRDTALDNVDLRYAQTLQLCDNELIAGVSVNNNPTVAEVSNSVPAWRFPYMSSELVPGTVASPLVDGGLEGQVIGASAYTQLNDTWYAEAGAYRSLSRSTLDDINIDDEAGQLSGASPYWRFGYRRDMLGGNLSAGVFGLDANLHPERLPGPSDKYRDLGIDAAYQYLGDRRNVFTVNASYIDETSHRDATFGAGDATDLHGSLERYDLAASYYRDQTWGLTAAVFSIHGDRDHLLYTPEPDAGSRDGTPQTSGLTLQADWTPFGKNDSWRAPLANLRLGLQYTMYGVFNGSDNNYDGFGRNAGDNDTLFGFAWLAI